MMTLSILVIQVSTCQAVPEHTNFDIKKKLFVLKLFQTKSSDSHLELIQKTIEELNKFQLDRQSSRSRTYQLGQLSIVLERNASLSIILY